MTRGMRAGTDPAQKEKADASTFHMVREGKSVKEVARELNVTCSRVHQRLHDHRQRMRRDAHEMDDEQFEAAHGVSKAEFLDSGEKERQAAEAWLSQDGVRRRLLSLDAEVCDCAVYEARQHGCTLQQIADILGVSRVRVAQRERAHRRRITVAGMTPRMI